MTLAILGGTPAFDHKKHVGQPSVPDDDEFMDMALRILSTHRYTNDGPVVRELEDRIRELLGVKECVAIVNATAGLEMLAYLFASGGEVIMPSFTFIATAHAAKWIGSPPVFVDIDQKTHCLDPGLIEAAMTKDTRAICGVHTWGHPCAIDELAIIAKECALPLYFDAAHAFYCAHKDKKIGNFGDAEVFSFHATKFLHSFEGGAITTNNPWIARDLRRMRNFGYEDSVVHGLGINAKMTEICAAMGIVNLAHITQLLQHNMRVQSSYIVELTNMGGITLAPAFSSDNAQYVVVEVDEEKTGLTREKISMALWEENILARTYFFPPCHWAPPYNRLDWDLPVTEALAERVLVLPSGPMVSPQDATRICEVLAEIIAEAEAIMSIFAKEEKDE